jgi:tetratricopeptide (TPR) repeat protein
MKKLIFLGIVFLFVACPPTAKNAARIYIQQGEYEAAKEQIMAGIQSTPNDFEYYVLLAKVEIGTANWLAASDAFSRSIAVDSVKAVNWMLNDKLNISVYWQALYNAAISLTREKKYDRALKNLKYCEVFDPGNVNQYILEGGIYGELGEKDKAKAAHAKALSIDPENPEAYFLVGRAKFEGGEYDSAIVDFMESERFFLKKYDRSSKVVFQNLPAFDKGVAQEIVRLWGGKNEEALDAMVKVNLGFDGGLSAQRRVIEQFCKATEELARTYYYIGMAYYNLRNDSLAMSNLLKSLDLKGDDIDALYYTGEMYLKLRKHDASIAVFKRITELREDDTFAWFYLGVNYTQKKEYQKAVDIYENKVLSLEPRNVDAMTNLAYVYREMGNNKKALEWLTKAEKLLKEQ